MFERPRLQSTCFAGGSRQPARPGRVSHLRSVTLRALHRRRGKRGETRQCGCDLTGPTGGGHTADVIKAARTPKAAAVPGKVLPQRQRNKPAAKGKAAAVTPVKGAAAKKGGKATPNKKTPVKQQLAKAVTAKASASRQVRQHSPSLLARPRTQPPGQPPNPIFAWSAPPPRTTVPDLMKHSFARASSVCWERGDIFGLGVRRLERLREPQPACHTE